jgi:hypothetical protein
MKRHVLCITLALLFCASPALAQKKPKGKKPPASQPADAAKDKEKGKEKAPPPPPPDTSKMLENMGLLDLEGSRDGRTFATKLQTELQKNLAVPLIPKDPLSTLAESVKCKLSEPNCLGYVAAYIGTRYLLYGSSKSSGGKLSLELHLYDAKTPKEVIELKTDVKDINSSAEAKAISNQILLAIPELKKAPPPPPKPKEKKYLVSKDSVLRRAWFWSVIGGTLAGGATGGYLYTTRPPDAIDSDLGTFPIQK